MTSIHAGEQLDHYRIDELVARSGMASIFKATDMRTGRPVAIKIPHPEMEVRRKNADDCHSAAVDRNLLSEDVRTRCVSTPP